MTWAGPNIRGLREIRGFFKTTDGTDGTDGIQAPSERATENTENTEDTDNTDGSDEEGALMAGDNGNDLCSGAKRLGRGAF